MIRTREDLRAYLAADLRANSLERWRFRDRLLERPAHFQRLLRKSEYWTNTAHTPFGHAAAIWLRLRTKLLGERLGLYIPRNVFGPGLRVAHPGPIWVHYKARVGANCQLHQGVTIGEARGKVPVIGDDVWIYPHAMVLGVDVGNRASILAGAVVVNPVPDDAVVGGVPARTVKPSQSVKPAVNAVNA
jgi:serine O-acetyltransferase